MARRVRILCEDRRTERFLCKLCAAHGVEVLDVHVAPAGRGAASAWVRSQYAKLTQSRRAKNFQHNLGLLVHIDGDNVGVAGRHAELDAQLVAQGLAKRQADEPVAILAPTWCMETWLLHLAGLGQPGEDDQLKRPPFAKFADALQQLGREEREITLRAARAWASYVAAPDSLVDGRREARRVGIGA